MNFTSDNNSGASPQVLKALIDANDGTAPAYGTDVYTQKSIEALQDIFQHSLAAFLVTTGTASNALALGAITPPWGAIFCHVDAHIDGEECGAPELFTHGAKLVGIPGANGKITPEGLKEALSRFPRGPARQVQPASLSLSQATECGTVYSCDEIRALTKIAHEAGLLVHMDGARFANALVSLGCTPGAMSWECGIDVLSLGATKNGALACEAVIFFDRAKASSFLFQRKRGAHTVSKGRFLGAQLGAWLENGHWLDMARAANRQATRLSDGLAGIVCVRLAWPCQANEVFAILPRSMDAALRKAGALYHPWETMCLGESEKPGKDQVLVRLVASFDTQDTDVDRFVAAAKAGAKSL